MIDLEKVEKVRKTVRSLDDIQPGDVINGIFHEVGDQVWIKLPTILGVDISVTKLTVFMWIATALIIAGAVFVRRNLELVPRGKFANAVEALVEFIKNDIVMPNLKEDWKGYMPIFCTFFFFILVNNSIGLIPYLSNPTGNVNVTGTLAGLTFLTIILGSINKNGLRGFLRGFVPEGIPVWIAPIIVIAEIVGLFTKSLALCIRLFANMVAGHIVILTFIGLIYIMKSWFLVPVPIISNLGLNLLEILIILIQTYVFTYLSAIFVGMLIHAHH
ncbi:MAG: F0F1 ATP synthase subunit A [Fidelibacterota bacterium]